MSKTSGLGDNIYVGGYDLSGDIGSLSRIGGGPNPLVLTGINASGFEREGGVRDGALDFSSWFNPAAAQAHPVLSALPTSDVIITYCRGTTLGDPAAAQVSKQTNYDGDRGTDGSLAFAVNAVANGFGIEWGDQLTAGKRTDVAPTAGTAFDSGVVGGTAFGLQAYLHVFALTGDPITITIQESSDNGADAYADVVGGAFTEVSAAPATERIATAVDLAVERYLKVTTTGTFTSCTFAVMMVRNVLTPAF